MGRESLKPRTQYTLARKSKSWNPLWRPDREKKLLDKEKREKQPDKVQP